MTQAGQRRGRTPEPDAAPSRWEIAAGIAGIGTFEWDLETGALDWNAPLLDLFGLDEDSFVGTLEAFNACVLPDDLPRVTAALQEAVTTGGEFECEYRIARPDGELRWVHARGRALRAADGRVARVVGAALDTTEVHEGEARVARVLEGMSAAFYALDRSWRFTYVNAEAERLLGRGREELLGGELWELFPATVGSAFEEQYRRAVDTGRATTFQAWYPPPLDGWFELRAWPTPDGLSVYFLEVTEQRAALQRLALLSRVTSELAATLDTAEAVARLSRVLVPDLADWCIVSLVSDEPVDPRRRVRDVSCCHADPQMQPVLERYADGRLAQLRDDSFLARALAGDEPVVLAGAVDDVAASLPPGETRDALLALGPRAAVLLPVRARGRTRGLLTLCWDARGAVRPEDLETAVEIAARAGLALDNARLYEQQRELSEGLQRSLLTEPPAPDHVQVVVRYTPATELARVGGDWYDAFLQPDGALALVIGDVVGHDVTAAAAMGQLRSLLRGIAATTGEGPAQVLTRLDQAMELLQVGTTATAVVARLEQTPSERDEGVTRLRWSNAGHPPPVVLLPDGEVRALDAADPDLLLGILPDLPRHEQVVTLPRGATVLLFTDGLVERRGRGVEEGLAELRAELAELAARDLDLDALCDELLARMLAGGREDDVALAAVRLHPQDGPRPPQAGPVRVPRGVPPEA